MPRNVASSKLAQSATAIDIGIPEKKRLKIADGLSGLLADTYTLYLKTHNFHWNVTGPMFNTLHTMFETEYNELALAVDQIAERIRSLGVYAPGSYKQFLTLTSLEEETDVPSAEDMVLQLVKDTKRLRERPGVFSPSRKTDAMSQPQTFSRSAYRSMKRQHGCCGLSCPKSFINPMHWPGDVRLDALLISACPRRPCIAVLC